MFRNLWFIFLFTILLNSQSAFSEDDDIKFNVSDKVYIPISSIVMGGSNCESFKGETTINGAVDAIVIKVFNCNKGQYLLLEAQENGNKEDKWKRVFIAKDIMLIKSAHNK
jgi:hypothetical protein